MLGPKNRPIDWDAHLRIQSKSKKDVLDIALTVFIEKTVSEKKRNSISCMCQIWQIYIYEKASTYLRQKYFANNSSIISTALCYRF